MMFGSSIYGPIAKRRRFICRALLVVIYFVGLLIGGLLAIQASEVIISWMRTADIVRVSIVDLLIVSISPFLISAFAVLLCQHWLLLLICFIKTFSFGYCAVGICLVFGDAGWLGCMLLLFTDLCSMPLFMLFCLRYIDGTRKLQFAESLLLCSVLFLAGSLDHCVVTPFIAGIIEF